MPDALAQPQRWALLLQYDGSEFAGSQWQPQLPTVQGALEQALASLTDPGGTAPRTRAALAGRTDAGVHATGQVAAFSSASDLTARRWIRGLNHFLPDAVAVQAMQPVAPSFDPRRDAIARVYRYRLRIAAQRQPLWARRAWIVPPPFDPAAARAALAELVGQCDFAAFSPPTSERSTVRTLHSAELTGGGVNWEFRFRADAFLQHQVRRMAGAVVEVARGRVTLDTFRRNLRSAAPGGLGPTAPANALTLARVEYDKSVLSDWELTDVDDCSEFE